MAWKIEVGTVKASLWPDAGNGTVWCPVDDEVNDILAIDGVCEVSTEYTCPYKIIVEADSLEDLPEVICHVSQEAMKIIRIYAPGRRRESRKMLSALRRWSN